MKTTPALYSITWSGLDSLLHELKIPALDLNEFILPPFNTHSLRPILMSRGIYPARDFPHLIVKRPPDIFVTYDWRENVLSVRASILNTLKYCLRPQAGTISDFILEEIMIKGVTFWIDWIFLNQSSRNVDEELDNILPTLFKESSIHAVMSTTALSRAWCCYELAQFNKEFNKGNVRDLLSLIPGDMQKFPLWEKVISTDPLDKLKIEKRIQENFPGGIKGLEFLMIQAGVASDFLTQTGGLENLITNMSRKWVERFLHGM